MRLLDRALRAHGRDHRYRIDVWQAGMLTMAQAAAAALTDANPEEKPLADTLRRDAGLIADALAALPRDRLGVPELQTQAASELLVVYVAARET